jgi:hypothetical protein
MPTANEYWSRPAYTLRVRAATYLWGSAGLTRDVSFQRPLHLHVRNDDFGEPITIATRTASGAKANFGSLGAGECLTVPVQDVAGVVASCESETTVYCLIHD